MIRLILWFAGVLTVAAGAAYLADYPGYVIIDFPDHRVETSFAALVFMVAGLSFLAGLTVWLVEWLRREFPLIGSNHVINRQKRGLKLLNQSLVALSAGDHTTALRLAEQAEVLLPPQPMVHLVAAEAATRGGDHAAAAKRYEALEKSEDARLIGLRGLLSEARRLGRESEALRLARTAFEENRKSPWVLNTLFALEVEAGNWKAAEDALAKVQREKLVDRDTAARHRGALLYAEATEAQLKGDRAAAKKAYKRAVANRPGFAPAIVGLAGLEMSAGSKRQAEKTLKAAWTKAPHPSLAKLFKELDPTEAKSDWLKRVRVFIADRPDHPHSLLLLVDALMDAGEYATAKPVLERLTKESPSREAWQYRLALAHALKEDPDPIEAALSYAPESASWLCHACGTKSHNWAPLCPSCDTFDALDWREGVDIKRPKKTFNPDSTISLLTGS